MLDCICASAGCSNSLFGYPSGSVPDPEAPKAAKHPSLPGKSAIDPALRLIGARGPPGFWSIFGLFGPFLSVSGPRGSVCRDRKSVNTNLTRRIDPRYPEASACFFILTIPHFFQPYSGTYISYFQKTGTYMFFPHRKSG